MYSAQKHRKNKVARINTAGSFAKIQSAMEYLMTYGWAILIIAIVLGAMFQLGVFDPSFFTPKANPGSCSIFRPNGPGTTDYINLRGICNLVPKFVGLFDGHSSYVDLQQINQEAGTSSISFSLWFNEISVVDDYPMIFGDTGQNPRNGYNLFVWGSGTKSLIAERFVGGTLTTVKDTAPDILNTWYYATVTYDGTTLKLYKDGVNVGSVTDTRSISLNSHMYLGAFSQGGLPGNYRIANVQIYNTNLSASSISALYSKGIGGAPIDLQHLIGWWPLNEDTIDYSGNNNHGTPTSVTYSSFWTTGYTPP